QVLMRTSKNADGNGWAVGSPRKQGSEPRRIGPAKIALGSPPRFCYERRPDGPRADCAKRKERRNMKRFVRAGTVAVFVFTSALLPLLAGAIAHGQQMIQYGFGSREPVWVRGPHDAAYKETLHRLTDDSVHNGQRSETIQLEAERGTFIHY